MKAGTYGFVWCLITIQMRSLASLTIFAVILACAVTIYSQSEGSTPGSIKVVVCRDCEEIAISLPNPEYPAYVAFGPHKYEGEVGVQVVINNEGRVESAKAIFGHLYFRSMLEKASLTAVFRPTVTGTPTKIRGILVFKITPPKDGNITAPPQPERLIRRRRTPPIISCGVCNQEAIYLPKPKYPPAANAVNISGSVSVQILIDTKGNVIRAKVFSGHPLLRAESVKAALRAKFTPRLLGENPAMVYGTILYQFVSSKPTTKN